MKKDYHLTFNLYSAAIKAAYEYECKYDDLFLTNKKEIFTAIYQCAPSSLSSYQFLLRGTSLIEET